MTTLAINHLHVDYQLDGDPESPVLVLSNSLGTTRQMWAAQIAAFSKTHRVLSYDSRGHGGSSAPAGPYTIEQLGQDVLALVDALQIQTFSFCGISMGGLIGQWLGVHAASRLDRLVVCNTAARIGQETAWKERAGLVRSQGMGPVADGSAGRWFTAEFVDTHPATVATLIAQLRDTPPEGYAACCEALAMADLREDIKTITVPVLVIAGTHDPVTTVDDADFIAGQASRAKLVPLEASHLSNIEAAAAFNAAVGAFLGD